MKDKNYNQGEENPSKRYFDTTYDKGFTAVPEKHESAVAFDYKLIYELINEIGLDVDKFISGFGKETNFKRSA